MTTKNQLVAHEHYINLLLKVVSNSIYNDDLCLMAGKKEIDHAGKFFCKEGKGFAYEKKYNGEIWPSKAHTMIGLKRLNNVKECIYSIIENNIPGDFVETGVWRGGTCIFMSGLLKIFEIKDRLVWVCDSFEGFPKAKLKEEQEDDWDWDRYGDLSVSLETVKENFKSYGLLSNQVKFLKGFFSETLPNAPIESISLLRLDGDMYESTMDSLNNLYKKLSKGGFIIVDDYLGITTCKKAVDEFRKKHNIKEKIIEIDNFGIYWQKNTD